MSHLFCITINKLGEMKNYLLKFALMAFFMLAYSLPTMAQQDDPKNPPSESDDPPAPIDDAMMLLVMAGILVGGYFLMKRKQMNLVK